MMMRAPFVRLLVTVAVGAAGLLTCNAPALGAGAGQEATVTFGAAGDMGGGPAAAATLHAIAGAKPDFFVHLGDLSYDDIKPESAWCDFAKSNLGTPLPYEIVAGEHDAGGQYSGPTDDIDHFAACMPNQLNVSGSYGKQYYFDYPPAAPLVRMVMISPGLSIYAPKNFPSYAKGTPAYAWVQGAVDGARAAGIPWVVVGMAFDCVTAGEKVCEIGPDLFNLLISERVDLILQAHEHGYERSKQLAQTAGCPTIRPGPYNAACVAADGGGGQYAKGLGSVVVISGTAGIPLRPMNDPVRPEAAYFDSLMGANLNPANGFVLYTVTADRLAATFVASGPTSFQDSFTIDAAGVSPPANSAPTAAPQGPVQPSAGDTNSPSSTGQPPVQTVPAPKSGLAPAGRPVPAPTSPTRQVPPERPPASSGPGTTATSPPLAIPASVPATAAPAAIDPPKPAPSVASATPGLPPMRSTAPPVEHRRIPGHPTTGLLVGFGLAGVGGAVMARRLTCRPGLGRDLARIRNEDWLSAWVVAQQSMWRMFGGRMGSSSSAASRPGSRR